MEPTLGVALLWMLFAGTHIGLATEAPRRALIHKLGRWGFIGLFSAVAVVTFAALVHYFAVHRLEGLPGFGLATSAPIRWVLYGLSALGTAVMGMSLFDYPTSAYALGLRDRAYEARGVSRISRHGFFAGVCLFSVAHTLLATHLVGTVFFACTALYTWRGSVHQDAKLEAERGERHRHFVAATSFFPFAAIAAGRQRLVLSEISLAAWVAGAATVFLLRTAHESIFAGGGIYMIGFTTLGAAIASLQAWRGQRKHASRNESAAAPVQ